MARAIGFLIGIGFVVPVMVAVALVTLPARLLVSLAFPSRASSTPHGRAPWRQLGVVVTRGDRSSYRVISRTRHD